MAVIAFFQCGTCNGPTPRFRYRRIGAYVESLFLSRADMLALAASAFATLPDITTLAWNTVARVRCLGVDPSLWFYDASDGGHPQAAAWTADDDGFGAGQSITQIELIDAAQVVLKILSAGADHEVDATITGGVTPSGGVNATITPDGDDSVTSSSTNIYPAGTIIDLIPSADNVYVFAEILSVPSGINVCP